MKVARIKMGLLVLTLTINKFNQEVLKEELTKDCQTGLPCREGTSSEPHISCAFGLTLVPPLLVTAVVMVTVSKYLA